MAGHKVKVTDTSTRKSVSFAWRCSCGKKAHRTSATAKGASRDAKAQGHR